MNETTQGYASIDSVINGRDFGEVISRYVRYHSDAKKIVEGSDALQDEIFAEAMSRAIYQIYLLGVEDGMKGAQS